MKLHILSDLHRDLAGEILIPAVDADVVILAGDIDRGHDSLRWTMQAFTQPTLLVLGNHEIAAGDERTLKMFREMAEGSNVTVLENDVWELEGVRFLGCTLWAPGNRRMRGAMRDSIAWLREMLGQAYGGTTVVITHHSPLHQSLPPEVLIDDAAAKRLSVDLRALIEPSNIALWIHGHLHRTQDYFCGKTRIVCNARGYSKRVALRFNPSCVVEV